MSLETSALSPRQGTRKSISTRATVRSDIHRAENASRTELPRLPRSRAFKSDRLLDQEVL